MKVIAVLLFSIGLSGCATNEKIPIDQVPMYGGLDRSSIPALVEADKAFISSVEKQFGTRQAAAKAWVDQGFAFYQRDDLTMSMRRFNQAWLLDPNNPEVFRGFSSILYDKGDNCGSMQILEKAEALGIESLHTPNQAGLLADLAMITALCAVDDGSSTPDNQRLLGRSNNLFLEAERVWPSAYLYDKWWQALYWQGEYAAAWKKVASMRAKGEEPNEFFLQSLTKKMSEPPKILE